MMPSRRFLGLLLLGLLAGPLAALADTLTLGVLAYRPIDQETARWQPLAEHLGKALPGQRVLLQALTYPELNRALERNELDFVLTNPAHYIELRQRNSLSGVLASLVESAGNTPLGAFGGVIFALASRQDLNSMQDLKERRVAFTGRSSFGGFQMQALELARADVPLPDKAHSLQTGMPQDLVIEAVLTGKADAGFVRTGVIEDLILKGRLKPSSLKILNSRRLQGFPYAVSTTLYPEWPFIALPHVDERTNRRVTSALLAIEPGTPLAKSLRLHGFTIAVNYAPVEELMRELRLPPFDAPPRVTLVDIWQRHRPTLIAMAVLVAAILSMTLLLAAGNRRLTRARRETDDYARRLQASEERLQLAINGANDGIWDWNLDTNAVYFSPKWKEMLGYADDELPNAFASFEANLHPVDKPAVMDMLDFYLKGDSPLYRVEFRMRHRDGGWRWILARGEALRDKEGRPFRMLGSHTDISEQKRAEEALRQAASVFANCQEGIIITDAEHRIIDVNPAFTRITGYRRDEVLGKSPSLLSSGRHDEAFYAEMWRTLNEEGIWRGEIWNRRKDGEFFAELLSIACVRDFHGQSLRYVGVFSDISHLKAQEEELNRIAHYDTLTGLPNRRLLADRIELARAHAKRGGKALAVCYLDLDGFKQINDRHGHEAGDQVLVHVTRALRQVLRGDDTLARLGGDEFVMLFGEIDQIAEGGDILERVLATVAATPLLEGAQDAISASIGVTYYPQDEADAETLLRHADRAMYRAKKSGKNCYRVFDPAQDE